jgi:hypothetical protein
MGQRLGGREKGTPDKQKRIGTASVRQVLERACPDEWEEAEWKAWLAHPDPKLRFQAFTLAMAYKHGKPIQPVSGAPVDTDPIRVEVTHIGASKDFFAAQARLAGLAR